jgi:hypothetical protein
LKDLAWVRFLPKEELPELRIAGFYVFRRCRLVVGEVVAAAEGDGGVDQAAELVGGTGYAGWRAVDMQVEYDARKALARPTVPSREAEEEWEGRRVAGAMAPSCGPYLEMSGI